MLIVNLVVKGAKLIIFLVVKGAMLIVNLVAKGAMHVEIEVWKSILNKYNSVIINSCHILNHFYIAFYDRFGIIYLLEGD